MTSDNGQVEPEMSALDFLLKGKTTAFQRDLLQLARQKSWDEDDPGFAVPMTMGHIEHVLEVYPQRIRAAMEEISQQQVLEWQRIQAALSVSAMRGVKAADQIDRQLTEVSSLLDSEMAKVEGLLQKERLALQMAMTTDLRAVLLMMSRERVDMIRAAQLFSEQQKQVLIAQTQVLIQEGAIASQRQAVQQVREIVKGVRKKHFWETISVALLAAMAILAVGWIAGLLLGRQPLLNSQLELLGQHAAIQQVETGWILEKANRAECFYGIKPQSDPQCQ